MLYDTPTYTMSVKKFSFHSEGVNNIEKEMEGSHWQGKRNTDWESVGFVSVIMKA